MQWAVKQQGKLMQRMATKTTSQKVCKIQMYRHCKSNRLKSIFAIQYDTGSRNFLCSRLFHLPMFPPIIVHKLLPAISVQHCMCQLYHIVGMHTAWIKLAAKSNVWITECIDAWTDGCLFRVCSLPLGKQITMQVISTVHTRVYNNTTICQRLSYRVNRLPERCVQKYDEVWNKMT